MKILPFHIADALCNRICAFLVEMGGAYTRLTPEVQQSVLIAMYSRQFVIRISGNGDIQYFACWWCVHPKDVDALRERVKPVDIYTGTVMYVVEAGNRMGRRGMIEMVKRIRDRAVGMRGVFWHRPTKEDRVYDFPSQKGKEAIDGGK